MAKGILTIVNETDSVQALHPSTTSCWPERPLAAPNHTTGDTESHKYDLRLKKHLVGCMHHKKEEVVLLLACHQLLGSLKELHRTMPSLYLIATCGACQSAKEDIAAQNRY